MPDDHAKAAPETLEALVSYMLARIVNGYNTDVQAQLKGTGLTQNTLRALVALKVMGRLTVSDLCFHAIAEQPTMSRALDRLERDGLISRERGEHDHRARYVRLTPAGEARYAEVWPVMAEGNARLLSAIPESDQAELMRILQTIWRHQQAGAEK